MEIRRVRKAAVGQIRSFQTILTAIGFCVLHAWTYTARGRGANVGPTLMAVLTLWRLLVARRPWRRGSAWAGFRKVRGVMMENSGFGGFRAGRTVFATGRLLTVLLIAGAVAFAAPAPGRESVTRSLNRIAAMSSGEAAREATAQRTAMQSLRGEDQPAAALLAAFALERAGDVRAAIAAYRAAGNLSPGTPYAVTAALRLRLLEEPQHGVKALEEFYKNAAKESEAEGWFLVSNNWVWTTSRRAAWQALVDLRSDRLSFRLLAYLHAQSTFPAEYAYLFVFLVLGIGAKILELPLMVRTAKVAVGMEKLKPEVARLTALYGYDRAALNREVMGLYKRRGVNLLSGCATLLVDAIFVIWGFVAVSHFSPQLALDGARFWLTDDVLVRSAPVLFLWSLQVLWVVLLNPAKQPGQTGMAFASGVLSCVLFCALGWFGHWPAYVFIFWGLLGFLGWVSQLILVPVRRAMA